MRNVMMSLAAIALLIAAGVQAQAPQAQPDPKQIVTITGCVQNESEALKRPAATPKMGMGDEFVLTHSTIKAATATAEPPTQPKPAEPAAAAGAAENKIYRVTGDQEASLKSHLGHKVEITGTFKSEADARRELGAIGTSGKPPATPAEPTAMNTPEVTVNSVRMISESCGG